MGWAARCRTGFWARRRLAARRRWATRVALPKLILVQIAVLLYALMLFPFRLVAFLVGYVTGGSHVTTEEGQLPQDH